ncbi:MAG: hypothetical protein WC365_07605 [Candidatus Babeliales bacterium]|jgi:formyltetrahydrofolate hydrolase
MQKAPHKPEKNSQNVQFPSKMKQKASTKEILVLISENQQKQAETLVELKVGLGKLEQKVDDYICNHDKVESERETHQQQNRGDLRWIIGTFIGIILAIISFAWGALR